MQLEIADTILKETHLTAADLKLELAVLLWQKGSLTESGAALLAGQSLSEFKTELRCRKLSSAQANSLEQVANHLPLPARTELLDFAQFLADKYLERQAAPAQPEARVLQAGKRLAELGGTQPQLQPVPRRREEAA